MTTQGEIRSVFDLLAITAWFMSLIVVVLMLASKAFQLKILEKKISLEAFVEFILWPYFVYTNFSKKEKKVLIVLIFILILSTVILISRGVFV